MRGNIGFGTRLPNTNISRARQTLVPYSTFSNSAGGSGRGGGRGSSLASTGQTDFSGRAQGKPECDESNSPESPVTPGTGPSGLGHGRGKHLPPPSLGRSSFASILSSWKPHSTGRGQTTSPPVSQPTNDSEPKKPVFFERDDSSSPTVETRPNISSNSDREVSNNSNKLLGNMAGALLYGLGRGKPMKQPDPENQVKEENRHLRTRPTLDPTASKTVPKSRPELNQEDAVMQPRKEELKRVAKSGRCCNAKEQQEVLERVTKTLPENAPSSVKRFADLAVLSLQVWVIKSLSFFLLLLGFGGIL